MFSISLAQHPSCFYPTSLYINLYFTLVQRYHTLTTIRSTLSGRLSTYHHSPFDPIFFTWTTMYFDFTVNYINKKVEKCKKLTLIVLKLSLLYFQNFNKTSLIPPLCLPPPEFPPTSSIKLFTSHNLHICFAHAQCYCPTPMSINGAQFRCP